VLTTHRSVGPYLCSSKFERSDESMRLLPVLVQLGVLTTTVLAATVLLDDRRPEPRAPQATKLSRKLNGACYAPNTDIFSPNPPSRIALSAADDIIACSQICAYENGGHLDSPFVGLFIGGPSAGILGCECGKVKSVGQLGTPLEGPHEHTYCNGPILGFPYGGAPNATLTPITVVNANLGRPQSLKSLHRNGACYTCSTAAAWSTRVVPDLGPIRTKAQQIAGCSKLCNPRRGNRSAPIVGLASAGPSQGTACFCIGTSIAPFLGSPVERPTSHEYCSSELGHVGSDGTADGTYFTFFDATA
jgi:hypothetical protein